MNLPPAIKALVVLVATVLAQSTPSVQRTKVVMSTTLGEYYGAVYVPAPSGGADYVVLRGEPLSVRISLVNRGTDEQIRRGATAL